MNKNYNLSFQEIIGHVKAFHESFLISNNEQPTILDNHADHELRHRLMQEENDEYLDAAANGNITEIADALGDQLYILCGTLLRHGLQHKIEEIFLEIQKSNMSKLDANGVPIFREDGKVMKSDRYFKPDIQSILTK